MLQRDSNHAWACLSAVNHEKLVGRAYPPASLSYELQSTGGTGFPTGAGAAVRITPEGLYESILEDSRSRLSCLFLGGGEGGDATF
jgi:hypothetical protein